TRRTRPNCHSLQCSHHKNARPRDHIRITSSSGEHHTWEFAPYSNTTATGLGRSIHMGFDSNRRCLRALLSESRLSSRWIPILGPQAFSLLFSMANPHPDGRIYHGHEVGA